MSSFQPIPIAEFQERTDFSTRAIASLWDKAVKVVALRDLNKIDGLQAMPMEYLSGLLGNIGLVGDPAAKPYRGKPFEMQRIDPRACLVAQTFVERSKCLALMENVTPRFSQFAVSSGFAKLTPYVVLGRDATGEICIAHYVPPIIEESGGQLRLLDGTHRSYLAMSVGTTAESIIVRNVVMQFPTDAQAWRDVRLVDVKPPRAERFAGLKDDYFRDVKHIGIDG